MSDSSLDWFLARRYLGSRKGGRFLSLITGIALGGVALGVAALIVVIAVMNGMQEELRGKILDSSPHLSVYERGNALRLSDWASVAREAGELPRVVTVGPFIRTQVGVRRGEYAQTASLHGILLESNADPVTVTEGRIRDGVYPLEARVSGLPPLLVGSRLAVRMQIFTGDTVVLISLENIRTDPLGNLNPAMRQFEVSGTFSTGMYEYDIAHLYAPLDAVQDLLGAVATGEVTGLGIRLADPWAAPDVRARLETSLGDGYSVDSWINENQALLSALKLEKLGMTLVLLLIVVVAAFNTVSTLVMVVMDRTKEIGILKSMGMPDARIQRVFTLQGLWIGVVGTVLGAASGVLLTWLIHRFDLIRIPPDIYFVDHIPVSLAPLDVIVIVSVGLVLAYLATVYPARQASRLLPVDAIRHE